VLQVLLFLAAFLHGAHAQDPPRRYGAAEQASAQQPASAAPAPTHAAVLATPSSDNALDNATLEQADEEHNVTYMQSRITFKYNHDAYHGGGSGDGFEVNWLQSFGRSSRIAAEIEIPFMHFNGGTGEQSGNGIGDIKLEFRAMLGKGEKFEHAASFELTVPSASNDLVGEGETVITLLWGFSASLTPHTLLSGELGYNKAIHTTREHPGINNIEPELILTQAIAKRAGAYLDWDTYYDFNAGEYAQTSKVGLEFELDRKERWGLSPYFQFPLNHFTRMTDIANSAGVELGYYF